MPIPYRRIELAANIAIILVALLLGGVLVKRYLLTPSQPSTAKSENVERPKINAGTKLTVHDVDWGKSNQTLLMVLSTTCRFCTESAPFYKKLAEQNRKRNDIRLVAVLPQSLNDSTNYIRSLEVAVDQISQSSLDAVQVRGTPTLILVDRSGAVVDSWAGRLPVEQEDEVLKRFL